MNNTIEKFSATQDWLCCKHLIVFIIIDGIAVLTLQSAFGCPKERLVRLPDILQGVSRQDMSFWGNTDAQFIAQGCEA